MPDQLPYFDDRRSVVPSATLYPLAYEQDAPPLADSTEFRSAFEVLVRRRWTVLLAALLGIAISLWLAGRAAPVYRAEATVRLTNGNAVYAPAGTVPERFGDADPLQSRLQLVRSRGVAERAVAMDGERLRLRVAGIEDSVLHDVVVREDASTRPIALFFFDDSVRAAVGPDSFAVARYGERLDVGGIAFTVASRPAPGNAEIAAVPTRRAIETVQGGLHARARENTDVVDITYDAPDPQLAEHTVNYVVRAFGALLLEQSRAEHQRRVTFLAGQVKQNDAQLADAQQALASFRSQHRTYDTREEVGTVQAWLRTTNQQREMLVASRERAEQFLTQYEHATAGASDGALRALVSSIDDGPSGDPVSWDLYREMMRLQSARDSLTTGPYPRAPTHPEVARLDALLTTTRARLVNAVRGRISALRAQVASLDGIAARQSNSLQVLPGIEERERQLVDRVDRQAKVVDELRSDYRHAMLAEAAEGSGLEVVDYAARPTVAMGMPAMRWMVIGGMLGLVGGVLLAYTLERFNWTIRRREDIERTLRIPELATIPQAAFPGPRRPRLAPWRRHEAALPAPGVESGEPAFIDPFASEPYRVLRTNLLYASAQAQQRTITVTSAQPGEGKTTVVTNLALSFARYGMRVLLIDADVRRPAVHRAFGVPRAPGLVQYVAGTSPLGSVVYPTTVPTLHVLPAGSTRDSDAEPFNGYAVAALLARVGRDYDVVLLDSTPVLASSDAAIIAAHCDAAVLVVRAGQTDRDAARLALRQLYTVRANVVGAVLNDPDNRAIQSAYYDGRYDYGRQVAPAAAVSAAAAPLADQPVAQTPWSSADREAAADALDRWAPATGHGLTDPAPVSLDGSAAPSFVSPVGLGDAAPRPAASGAPTRTE